MCNKTKELKELSKVRARLVQAEALLKNLEFLRFFNQKCPVCFGWNASPQGETPRAHQTGCPLNAFLRE